MARTFQEWAAAKNKDIFGFEKNQKSKKIDDTEDMPIDPIDKDLLIDELLRMPPLGIKEGMFTLKNHIVWGRNSVNPISLDISPLGSYKLIIRQKTVDLLGNDIWLCKHVEPLIENDNNSNEIALAHRLYDKLELIDKEKDSAANRCDLEKLALKLAFRIKKEHPKIMFFDRIKKMNENHFLITMNYRGHGVAAPGQTRCEQYHINVVFDKDAGLVRIFSCEVTSPMRQHLWELNPSEFDEYFAPTQSCKQIEDAFINALSTY